MNRIIPLEVKVKVIEEVLCLQNVEEIAMQNNISPGAIWYWYAAGRGSASLVATGPAFDWSKPIQVGYDSQGFLTWVRECLYAHARRSCLSTS